MEMTRNDRNCSLILVSDAQSKAIEEAVKTLRAAGGFLREALGTARKTS